MTDASEILKMVENVDPNDVDKLDEIDARVHCFVHGRKYTSNRIMEFYEDANSTEISSSVNSINEDRYFDAPQYTRSRDYIKSIRPKGWRFTTSSKEDHDHPTYRPSGLTTAYNPVTEKTLKSPNLLETILPTEELAELHAIIQAIKYERKEVK